MSTSAVPSPPNSTPELLYLLHGDPADLADALSGMRAADIAEALRELKPDAAAKVLAALKDQFKDKLFHIGNGDMVSGDDIILAIQKRFPGSAIEIIKTSNPMPYPETRLASDFSRAKEQLGYVPDYPIDLAVADYGATLKQLENL